MEKPKDKAKLIIKLGYDHSPIITTNYYGGPDGKVYAIYYENSESGLYNSLVEIINLYYDYQKGILLHEVIYTDSIIREPLPDLKTNLQLYFRNIMLKRSQNYGELLDYLNSLFD